MNGYAFGDMLDPVYVMIAVGFILSTFIEHLVFKTFQVLSFFAVGTIQFFTSGQYVGITTFTITIFLLYFYGFFNRCPKTKMVLSGICMYTIMIGSQWPITVDKLSRCFLWLMYVVFFTLIMWIMFKDMLDKLKKKGREAVEIADELAHILRKQDQSNGGDDSKRT